MPPTNRKNRAAEAKRQQEQAEKTVIIPQITPEILEQRRREAANEARRRAAEQLQAAGRMTQEQPPQPAPSQPTQPPRSTRTMRIPRIRTDRSAGRTAQMPPVTQDQTAGRTAQTAPVQLPVQTAPSAAEQPAQRTAPPAVRSVPQPQTPAAPAAPAKKETGPHRRTLAEAQSELDAQVTHEHVWLNNPVMVRGLGLAAVVAAATDADNALMLCVATLLLLTFTRVLAVAVCHLTRNRFRPLIYCYAAALCYIPTYIVVYNLFGADLAVLGIYLPLLVVDPAVLKRMEFDELETVGRAFRLGVNNSLGVCVATMLVGCLRELLAAGTIFEKRILTRALLPIADQVSGGFLIAGLLAAVWLAVRNMYVDYKKEEVTRLYGKRKR